MTSISDVQAALEHIPPHDRDTWVKIAMAVKSELGEAGRDIWEGWSQGAESYRPADAAAVWRSAKETGGVTIATLFHIAKEHGFDPASASPAKPPTPAEIAKRKARAEAERRKIEATHAVASTRAAKLWSAGQSKENHPYLLDKAVSTVETLRMIPATTAAEILGYAPRSKGDDLEGDLLLVPIKVEGKLTTIEMIDETGRKAALAGGRKSRGFWAAQRMPTGKGEGLTLIVCEGAATTLSAREATGHPAVAALSCVNIPAVTQQMRHMYPKARIIVCGEPGGGLKHAEQAAQENGATLAVWDGGDMNDLHQAQGLEAVKKLIEETTHQEGEPVTDRRRFTFIRAADAIRKQPDPQWLIKGLVEQASTLSVMGPSGCGKTFVVLDMGLCVATGQDWHGHEVVKSGPVLYVCGEGRGGIARRVEAWRQHHDLNLEHAPFFISSGPAQMLDPASLRDVEQAAAEIEHEHGKPAFIIVDTLNRNFGPGDENSTSDMTRFIAALDGLRDRFQCAVCVVHHTGHNASERGRGSSALYAALDFEYRVVRQGETVLMDCSKSKDFEPLEKMAFQTVTHEVGTDSDGETITSLALEKSNAPVTSKAKLSPQQRIALDALKIQEENAKQGVHIDDWRNEAYARGIADTATAKRKAFARARTALLDTGQVLTRDDLYWTPGQTGTLAGHVTPCPAGRTGTHPLGVSRVPPPDNPVAEYF